MAYTDIPDTDIDADSDIDDAILEDLVENAEYNHDHAMRGGTHLVGVRLAVARGVTAFSDSISSGSQDGTQAIVFATDAIDGDPNFSEVPVFKYSMEEDGTGVAWSAFTQATSDSWEHFVESGSQTSAGVTIRNTITGSSSDGTFKANINWIAFGLVTAGE